MILAGKEKLVHIAILVFTFFCSGLNSDDRGQQGCQCRWAKDERANFDIPFEENYLGNNGNADLQENCTFRLIEFLDAKDGEWECQKIVFQQKRIVPKFNYGVQENTDRNFTVIPQDGKVILGSETMLSCAFSTQAPWCYWTKDFDVVAIEGMYSFVGNKQSGNCSIVISNASLLDNGLWECHYPKTKEQSRLYSGSSTLTVVVLPSSPIITVNGRKVKDGQKVYINGKWQRNKRRTHSSRTSTSFYDSKNNYYTDSNHNNNPDSDDNYKLDDNYNPEHNDRFGQTYYPSYRDEFKFVPNNAIDISCWSLNGHPAATLQWSGPVPNNTLSSDEKITPSKFASLYNSKVTFSFDEINPNLYQQTNITCSFKNTYFSDFPNLSEKDYSTAVELILSIHED